MTMVAKYNSNRSNRNFFSLIGLLALTAIALATDDEQILINTGSSQRKAQMLSSRSLSEIICETTAFSSFCEVLDETGMGSILGAPDGLWTVFVPTNAALEQFGIRDYFVASNNSNNETDYSDEDLIDLLFFHTIPDKLVRGTDLRQCGEHLEMNNGAETTVMCGGNGGQNVFLSGSGNTAGMLPQVVINDVVACNGLIHVINGVLKDDPISTQEYHGEEPDQKANTDCQSVQDIICEMDELTSMCAFLDDERILESAAATNDFWTVFAPTDEAFDEIEDVLGGMNADEILDILKFHTVPGEEVFSDDLMCETDLAMGNGRSSRTTCSGYSDVFQDGPGNALFPIRNHPRIIEADLTACNGVVHIVDHVMLPGVEMTAMVGRTGAINGSEESRESRPKPGLASTDRVGGRPNRRPGRFGRPLRQVTEHRNGANRLQITP